MNSFSFKTQIPNWTKIKSCNIEELSKDVEEAQTTLDEIQDELITANVDNAERLDLLQMVKLMQLSLELKNIYLEDADSKLASLTTQIREERRISRLVIPSQGANLGELRDLRDEIYDLEQVKENLEKDLRRAEDALDSERLAVQELTITLKNEKANLQSLREANARLESDSRDLQNQLATQKDRFLNKNFEEEQVKAQVKDKNNQLSRYVTEIQLLNVQNSNMAQDIDAMTQELEVAINELDRFHAERDESLSLISKNDATIIELTKERDSLSLRIEDLLEQSRIKEECNFKELAKLKDEISKNKKLYKKSQASLSEKDLTVEKLQAELESAQRQLDISEIESKNKIIIEKDMIITELRTKLDESYKDFEILGLDWEKLEKLSASKGVTDFGSTRSQQNQLISLKERVEVYQKRSEETQVQLSRAEELLVQRDFELVSLRQKIEKYEDGYGLNEAVRDIKDLRARKNMNEKEISSLVQKINDLESQVSDLFEENEEFRQKLGIKDRTRIDLSNIRHLRIIELEQSKSLIDTLKKEIEKLEEERLDLKSKMRTYSINRGSRAVELGLSVEDLVAVEEYAAKLKHGIDPSGGSQKAVAKPVLQGKELDKLVMELERAHVEASDAREETKTMTKKMTSLSEQNKLLENAVKEISVTLVSSTSNNTKTSQRFGSNISMGVGTTEIINRLIAAIETKKGAPTEGNSVTFETHVHKDILEINSSLREQLLDERHKNEELLENYNDSLEKNEELIKEIDIWKKKAEAPNRRLYKIPPELALGSLNGYSSLADQLIEALMATKLKDKSLARNRILLEQTKNSYTLLAGHLKHLFKQNKEFKRMAEEAKEISFKNISKAEEERQKAVIKLEELEKYLILNSSTSDDIKEALIESQRKLVVFKVNEEALTRRYIAATESEQSLIKEVQKLKNDLSNLDRVARSTIIRLQKSKSEHRDKISSLQAELSESVPLENHMKLEHKFNLAITKNKILLEREMCWTQVKTRKDNEISKYREIEAKAHSLEVQLFEAQKIITSLNTAIGEFNQVDSNFKNLSEEKAKISKLEVLNTVLEKRTELAERALKDAKDTEVELMTQIRNLENLYMESKNETIKVETEIMNIKMEFEGGASKKDHEKILQQLESYKLEISNLSEGLKRERDLVSLAQNQASDLSTLRASEVREKEILRAAIRELQMENDEKLLIGKLHHHILTLQMNEVNLLRKMEKIQGKCLKLEHSNIQLENALDEKDNMIFKMRLEHKNRVHLLRNNNSDLRSKLTGSIPLEKYDRTCDLIHMMDQQKQKFKVEFLRIIEERQRLIADSENNLLTIKSQEELIFALKDSSSSARRLSEWHSRMSKLQLNDLSLNRDLNRSRESCEALSRELASSVARITQLEEDCVNLQQEMYCKQLEWEYRIDGLENQLSQNDEEREQILLAASSPELKQSLPDRSLPVGAQLEACLRLLVDRTKLAKAQELKIVSLETDIFTLKSSLDNQMSELRDREMELINTKLASSSKKPLIVHKQSSFSNEREELIRVAEETISSLKRQLSKKEETLEKYRNMIQELQTEIANQKEDEAREASKRTSEINNLTNENLKKLKLKPEIIPISRNSEENPNSDLVSDLEKLLNAKTSEVKELQNQIMINQDLALNETETMKNKVKELEEEIEQKNFNIQEKEDQLLILQQKLDESYDQISLSPSKELQDQYAKLKQETDRKDSKITSLTRVIQKLRTSLEEAAKAAVENKIKENNISLQVQTLIDTQTSSLHEKNVQLETKYAKACASYEKRCQEFNEMEVEVEKLRIFKVENEIEIKKQNETILRLVSELKSAAQKMVTLGGNVSEPDKPVIDISWVEDAQKAAATQVNDEPTKMERWEFEKKMNKKLEIFKSKLSIKTKELCNSEKNVVSLRATLERIERDRTRLSSKVSQLNKRILANNDSAQKEELQKTVEENLLVINGLKEKIIAIDVEYNKKINEERLEYERNLSKYEEQEKVLQEIILKLQEQLMDHSLGKDAEDVESSSKFENSVRKIQLENERILKEERERCKILEKEKLKLESNILEIKLEKERQSAALKQALKEKETETFHKTSLELPSLPKKRSEYKGKTSNELLLIIDQLSRAIEKVKSENELMKKSIINPVKHQEALRDLKKLREELDQAIDERKNADIYVRQSARLEEENAKTQKLYKKETTKNSALSAQIQELKIHNDSMKNEIAMIHRNIGSNGINLGTVDVLKATIKNLEQDLAKNTNRINEKDAIIQKLMYPDEGAESFLATENRRLKRDLDLSRSRTSRLTEELADDTSLRGTGLVTSDQALLTKARALERENMKLKTKLASQNPDLLEELEDLKFNYKESIKTNVKYEAAIKELCTIAGKDSDALLRKISCT